MQQDMPSMQPGARADLLRRRRRRSGQRGAFLVEMIIGLAILGVVLMMVIEFQDRNRHATDGRLAGEELAGVQAAFTQYFNTYREEILAATAATAANNAMVQKHCVVRVGNIDGAIAPGTSPGAAGANGTLMWSGGPGINNGLKTCAFDLSLLQARGMWPRHLSLVRQSPETGGAWRHVAIVKRVRGPGPDGVLGNADDVLTGDAEMLILRMNEGPLGTIDANAWRRDRGLQERTLTAAREAGPTAGFIPIGEAGSCSATRTAVQACGPGWQVDLSQWISPTQLTNLRNALPNN